MQKTIIPALLLACGAAQASDWVSVGTIVGGTTYVDRSSIRVSENIRRAWIKLVYTSHMKRGSGDDSNKWRIYDLSREAFDCAQELVRTEALFVYYEDGTNYSAPPENAPPAWLPVPPDTIADIEMKLVCAWNPK